MPCLRCRTCHISWPVQRAFYARCPECEEPTVYWAMSVAIDDREALSRKHHADFERYYAEREAKHNGFDQMLVVESD